jgi:hypothetical protein
MAMDDPFETFDTVLDLKDYKVPRMILSPTQWATYRSSFELSWNPVRFSAKHLDSVPKNQRGVYSFVVQPGIAQHPLCSYLLYVGKVEKQVFRDRYKQYLSEQEKGHRDARRVHVTRMLQKWKDHLWFCYAPVDDDKLIAQIEDALLAAYLPSHNRDFPASIRKDHAAALE